MDKVKAKKVRNILANIVVCAFLAVCIFMLIITFASKKDEDGVAAYCRVLDKGVSYEGEGSIGRVITVKRGTGLGYKVMMEGIRVAEEKFGQTSLRISAQQYAQGFYEKCGFVRVSEPYLEDNIPHVQMVRER